MDLTSLVAQSVLVLATISLPLSQLPISFRDSKAKTNHIRDLLSPVLVDEALRRLASIELEVATTTRRRVPAP
jgi:hypothetical protein